MIGLESTNDYCVKNKLIIPSCYFSAINTVPLLIKRVVATVAPAVPVLPQKPAMKPPDVFPAIGRAEEIPAPTAAPNAPAAAPMPKYFSPFIENSCPFVPQLIIPDIIAAITKI